MAKIEAKVEAKTSKEKVKPNVGQDILTNQNAVHALTYVPYFVGPIVMYFLAKTDKKALMHHVNYSLLMAVGAAVLFFLLKGFFANVVNIAYLVASWYFAFKAYSGETVQVEIFDTIEGKISETVKK